MMKLSDFSWVNAEINQDAEFSDIGHLWTKVNNRIVPILSNDDLRHCINNPEIAGIIISPDLIPLNDEKLGVLISEKPLETAMDMWLWINGDKIQHEQTVTYIHPSAKIHPSATISPCEVKIGKNVQIDEYVSIGPGTEIRDDVVINALTQIGSSSDLAEHPSLNALGSIIIEEETFIHANCRIECPIFPDTTIIGSRCQIDSLSIIRAGVKLGPYSLVAGLVTIGEYTSIGTRTWVGPGSTIERGIDIGESCYITLGSKVKKNIGSHKIVKDNWAVDRNKFKGIISG